MNYHINRKSAYSFASITDDSLEIVSAIVSIDLHEVGTIHNHAVALMYADALLSGAGKYGRHEFLDTLHVLGASIDVGVVEGVLGINVRATNSVFAKVLDLLSVLLSEPHFSDVELERIKNTVINSLHEHKENSKALALESLKNELYGKTDRKYSFDIEETISVIKEIRMSDLRIYHDDMLKSYWVCTMVGGKKTINAFEKMVQKHKKDIVPKVSSATHEHRLPKNKLLLKSLPSRQNIDFSIGAPVPFTLHHDDYIPLSFALSVLGKWGGFSGRLMSTVREKEGLTYGIYAAMEGFSGTEQGYWRIMTFFAPDKALQGLTSTFREVNKLFKAGITIDEFNSFKIILATGQALIQDSILGQLADLHFYHFHRFTLIEMNERKNKINTITIEEVNAAIRTYLNPNTLVVSGAGPVNAIKNDVQKFIKDIK